VEKGARAMSSTIAPVSLVFGSVLPKLDAFAMLDENLFTLECFVLQLTGICCSITKDLV